MTPKIYEDAFQSDVKTLPKIVPATSLVFLSDFEVQTECPGLSFWSPEGSQGTFLQDFNNIFGNIVLKGFLEIIFDDC